MTPSTWAPGISKTKLLCLFACLFAALVGPAGRAVGADDAGIVLSDLDDGKTIEAPAGKNVLIKLSGNLTTGYSWVVAKVDGPGAQQVGGVAYESGGGPGVGEGGTFLATFSVTTAGQAKITMEYRRPWEKDKPPAKTFALTVQVKGDPSTLPTTGPATGPATAPTSEPATQPTTEPTTQPTTAPEK